MLISTSYSSSSSSPEPAPWPEPPEYVYPVFRNATIQFAYKDRADWLSSNPTLLAGQIAIERDTGYTKCGDGIHDYVNLGYWMVPAASLYRGASFVIGGKPKADETITIPIVAGVNEFSMQAGTAGLSGVAQTAATAETSCTVQRNGVAVATLTWDAAATVADPLVLGDVTFSAGDTLSIVFGPTPDGTLSDIGITLGGRRVL